MTVAHPFHRAVHAHMATVTHKQTMADVARMFGVHVNVVAALNPKLKRNDNLKGKTVKLPIEVLTRKPKNATRVSPCGVAKHGHGPS